MKKLLLLLLLFVPAVTSQAATTNITPWTAIFQGVDMSYGRVSNGTVQVTAINCVRADLTAPGVRVFLTPGCTNGCAPGSSSEVFSENTSYFLEKYGVQAAVNGMFYTDAIGPGDSPLGTLLGVYGLAISEGRLVSPQDESAHQVTMFFSSNGVPTFVPRNWPPVNSNGVFAAVTGNILLLTNGMNAGTNAADPDPRTAVGISQDKRYLYLMTVDGRQSGWSTGLNFYETADWLARFGAYEGMAVDGGGSTTMSMADCLGKAIRLNRPSFLLPPPLGYGRERNIGNNIGVYALPLVSPIKDVSIQPGATTAVISWNTDQPTATQVEYGLTTNYGNATPLDVRLIRHHFATLNGLLPGSNYYFRAVSSSGVYEASLACSFSTTSSVARSLVFGLTNAWRYSTNNLDSTPVWKASDFEDFDWFGPSNGCLHIENSNPAGVSWPPRTTVLPPGFVIPIPRTFYFRTQFNLTGNVSGLTFSNYIDDGAVFYLNGGEIGRVRMPAWPTMIFNSTAASGGPCVGALPPVQSGDASVTCPDVFSIGGSLLLTNLVQGDNILAVELHNAASGSDVLFGCALIASRPGSTIPRLFISSEDGVSTISWNGDGFVLQRSYDISSPANWADVPGPITQSSVIIPNGPTAFYRLRN